MKFLDYSGLSQLVSSIKADLQQYFKNSDVLAQMQAIATALNTMLTDNNLPGTFTVSSTLQNGIYPFTYSNQQ